MLSVVHVDVDVVVHVQVVVVKHDHSHVKTSNTQSIPFVHVDVEWVSAHNQTQQVTSDQPNHYSHSHSHSHSHVPLCFVLHLGDGPKASEDPTVHAQQSLFFFLFCSVWIWICV